MELSNILKKLRLEQGYTQQQIAEKLNVPYQSYQRWEKGKKVPSKNSLEKLGNVFSVSVSYLLGETNVKQFSELLNISEQLDANQNKYLLEVAKSTLKEQKAKEKQLNDYVQHHLTSGPPKPLHLDFAQKLRLLLAEHNITQANLARLMDVSRQTISNYASGKAKPTQEHLEKLSDIFDISAKELFDRTLDNNKIRLNRIFDKLSYPRQEKSVTFVEEQLQEQESTSDIVPLRNSQAQCFRVYWQELSAGLGKAYTDEQDYDEVWGINNIKHDIAVWIKGDSMEPTFPNGDVALIVEQSCLEYNGQICAVDDVENGQAYIKIVFREEEGYRLHSINQSKKDNGQLLYPDFVLPYDESPKIIGKVVSHFTPIDN